MVVEKTETTEHSKLTELVREVVTSVEARNIENIMDRNDEIKRILTDRILENRALSRYVLLEYGVDAVYRGWLHANRTFAKLRTKREEEQPGFTGKKKYAAKTFDPQLNENVYASLQIFSNYRLAKDGTLFLNAPAPRIKEEAEYYKKQEDAYGNKRKFFSKVGQYMEEKDPTGKKTVGQIFTLNPKHLMELRNQFMSSD